MKVFWAWQADLPGKIARHFVRAALEEAIDRLKQPPDIEEPPEQSRRGDLHLDHDTKGLKGAPEIAHEIFKKIDVSTVVVADVTPIGRGPDRPSKDGEPQDPKSLMNPNVAIELGYAFGKLGTESFLLVLNEAYGDETGLPFDIAHRRRPITFNLTEAATPAEIGREKDKLVGQFVTALRPYLTGSASPVKTPQFSKAEPKIGKAIYFSDGEVLVHAKRPDVDFIMPFRALFYMRVIPDQPIDGHLDLHRLTENVGRYGQFGLPGGCFVLANKYGAIVASPAGNTNKLDDVFQYFRTGEIWGINADIIREGERGENKYVYTEPVENTLIAGLRSALKFHNEVSGVKPPFCVEVGLVGAAGRKLAHSGMILSKAPILASDTITHDAVLNKVDEQTQRSFLMEFFEKLNKDSGVARPKGLYGR
jgi:hypothetical protein